MGYVIADLNRPIIKHIGQNRSRANAMLGTRC